MILERVKGIFAQLGQDCPSDGVIQAEIDVDERFIGEDYAIPSAEGTAAITELASNDAVFLGPVYTAKGFAGSMVETVFKECEAEKKRFVSNSRFVH